MPQAPSAHKRPSVGARHKPKQQDSRQAGTARERGYTRKWEKFRLTFLRRNPLCEYCLADGRVVAASVCDHDLPHEQDAERFWDNTFTALCASCHSGDKQRMERRYSGQDLLDAINRRKGSRPNTGRGWVNL